jgi:ABC-type phosphate transport system substrate-binding protein
MSGRKGSATCTSFRLTAVVLAAMATLIVSGTATSRVVAASYQRISGEGSSWAANAIDAMRVNVKQFGITVDYNPSGSTAGRKDFLNGTVDFAAHSSSTPKMDRRRRTLCLGATPTCLSWPAGRP